jgi:hypothetical protein
MSFPATYNYSYYKGDTLEFVIRPKNSDGSAFDLEGFDADFTIATGRGTSTTSNPITDYEAQAVVDEANNLVTCTILPGVGIQLSAGTYVYDVQIDASASEVYTLVTGTISVTDHITGANP